MSTLIEEFKKRTYRKLDKLEWDYNEKIPEYRILINKPCDATMIRLREKYDLNQNVSKTNNDY